MIKRWRRDERGAQLVEFALVFLLLAMLVAGVWDLGRMFNAYITIANAARDGVRYAIRLPCINSEESQRLELKDTILETIVAEAMGSGIDLEDPDVTISIDPDPEFDGCPDEPGDPLQVTITFPHETWLGGITGIGDFDLIATARMAWFGNDMPDD